MTDKLQEIFDACPDETSIEFFDNDRFIGFEVAWSESGRGFGAYTFSVDKSTGKFHCDNECDQPETVKRVMSNLVDKYPGEVKKFFHELVDKGIDIVDYTITLNGRPINKDEY